MFKGDPTVYEPRGVRFYEAASQREMLLINEPSHPNDGWLCWRHPDGQWVTERKATDVDRMQIASARDRAAQKRDPLREPITEEENLLSRLAASEERARRAEAAAEALDRWARDHGEHSSIHPLLDGADGVLDRVREILGVPKGVSVVERARALAAALQDAIEAIDRAEPMRHSPWCNGVHEGGCCEGDYLMASFMERLRALAPPPAATETPEGASHE